MREFESTKDFGQREDEEAERLVREQPKIKPPRKDRRREDMHPDRDPDVDADPDLKGDPDLSMNYKSVGGSFDPLAGRVLRSHLNRLAKGGFEQWVEPRTFLHPETGNKVHFNSLPSSEQAKVRAQYAKESGGEAGEGKPQAEPDEDAKFAQAGMALKELAKQDPEMESVFKDFANPNSEIGKFIEQNPSVSPVAFFRGRKVPPGLKTIGDVQKAIQKATAPKAKGKGKKAPEQPVQPPAQPANSEPTEQQPPTTPGTPPNKVEEEAQGLGGELGKPHPVETPAPLEDKPPKAPKERPPPPQREIPPPKRSRPSRQEVQKAVDALYDSLPPKFARQFAGLHPKDIYRVIDNYKSESVRLKGELKSGKSVGSMMEEASSIYQQDPRKVKAPDVVSRVGKDGKKESVPFTNLGPEEQAEAMQSHRMKVVAYSMAVRNQALMQFKKQGVSPRLAGMLAESSLTNKKKSSKRREEEALSQATHISEKVGASNEIDPLTRGDRKRLLSSLSDPAAKAIAVGYFQGSDLAEVRQKYLSAGSVRRLSEHEQPEKIADIIKSAMSDLQSSSDAYPSDIISKLEDPAFAFRVRIMHQLRALDPDKFKRVKNLLSAASESSEGDKSPVGHPYRQGPQFETSLKPQKPKESETKSLGQKVKDKFKGLFGR